MSNRYTTIENESACATQICRSDCNNCRTFPTPFRKIGETPHCLFSSYTLTAGESETLGGDKMMRILFLTAGMLRVEDYAGRNRNLVAGQCLCLSRGEAFTVHATADAEWVVLSLLQRIEFCEQDIYDRQMPRDTTVEADSMPMLPINPALENFLSGLFCVNKLLDCNRYHRMKAGELFMMIKVLYTPAEHAYFFQSMIQPEDNFRVFVCNNYDKATNVADLADLAGMSLSVFKRHFAEHFNDSVYHWMMRQKALKVFSDIRDGENSTKVLMAKYGFRYYTQFSRFCKNYLQATPAQLISSLKEK